MNVEINKQAHSTQKLKIIIIITPVLCSALSR